MEIKEKRISEVKVAYIPYKGGYEKIPEHIQEIRQWAVDKGLDISKRIYGTYYNSPEEASEEELRYEIGIPFAGDVQPEGKVGIKEIPEHSVLANIHQGAYNKIGSVIHAIAKYALENGYEIVGPITEVYLNDHNMFPDEELLTEVQLPVIRK